MGAVIRAYRSRQGAARLKHFTPHCINSEARAGGCYTRTHFTVSFTPGISCANDKTADDRDAKYRLCVLGKGTAGG